MNVIKKIIRISGYLLEILIYIILYPFARLCYRNRHIHIFAERGTDARDNGYYMYRYYRQNHPEIESYYIITKNSPDRSKVLALGNVVTHGSLKHRLLFIAAEYKISTHIMGYSPNIYCYTKFRHILRVKGHRIFLQHGITHNDIASLYKSKTNFDLFICGAKPEYDVINSTYGYHNNEVKYTGLARFDGLHDFELKKQILCMPTWRTFLKYDSTIKIEDSDYVKIWNKLLNHKELISALRQNHIQLVFYPHYELQTHLHLFQSNCDEIIIASFWKYDVQQLLKESQLLITDYSCVSFDFAYMKKPVIYLQFDRDRFYKEHYNKGYFDHEKMGFGEVVFDENEAIQIVLTYINTNFEMKSEFKNRVDEFFPLYDKQNCERIFNEIENLSIS